MEQTFFSPDSAAAAVVGRVGCGPAPPPGPPKLTNSQRGKPACHTSQLHRVPAGQLLALGREAGTCPAPQHLRMCPVASPSQRAG